MRADTVTTSSPLHPIASLCTAEKPTRARSSSLSRRVNNMHMRQILTEMTTYLTCPVNKHGFRSNVNPVAGTERSPFLCSVRHARWHCLAIAIGVERRASGRSILLKCSKHVERCSSIFFPCANTCMSTRLCRNESIEYTGRRKNTSAALQRHLVSGVSSFLSSPFFLQSIHSSPHTHTQTNECTILERTNERTDNERE